MQNNYETCEEELTKWYGCPRHFEDMNGEIKNDSFWAEFEVDFAVSGWVYDLCCNPRDQGIRHTLDLIKYCDDNVCTYNPGADFCIRSPRHDCYATISGEQREISVSNQCCYLDGSLIDESHPNGAIMAGRMHRQLSSIDNLSGHFWHDLYPYTICCSQNPQGTDCLDKFKTKRKTIIGSYLPRTVRISRGASSIETGDGLINSGLGLGVFLMLSTRENFEVTVQVFTRVEREATLFTGIAVRYNYNLLECYINRFGTSTLAIGGQVISTGDLNNYVLSNFEVIENADGTFEFRLLGINFIIIVIPVRNFLNFCFIFAPRTFGSDVIGLLGNMNGITTDDFQTPGNASQ